MGFEFLLNKSAGEKLNRARQRNEKFGSISPDLASAFTPTGSTVTFRCQLTGDAGPVKKGDQVMLFTQDGQVKVVKQNKAVGDMIENAASDFIANFHGKELSEIQLGEVANDPSELDRSFDVLPRPPWDNTETTE